MTGFQFFKIEAYQEYNTGSNLGGLAVIQKLMGRLATYQGYDAIAISTADQVDPLQGHIMYANENIPDYTGIPIRDIIELKFHVLVRVENDVNTAALGEAHFGAGRFNPYFLYLTYGTGIGGAIVMNGSIFRGLSGSAREFGHIITHAQDRANTQLRSFYYEHYASMSALTLIAQKTRMLIMRSFAPVQIKSAMLDNRAGLLGAASLFLKMIKQYGGKKTHTCRHLQLGIRIRN